MYTLWARTASSVETKGAPEFKPLPSAGRGFLEGHRQAEGGPHEAEVGRGDGHAPCAASRMRHRCTNGCGELP